jgi:hypothetical protein
LTPVLVPGARLALQFWRRNFWFCGAPDEELHRLTGGRFAPQVVPGHTHPVFALRLVEHGIGCTVCPCSSSRPYDAASFRYIRKGCELLHTGHRMDRDSHLIEGLAFTLPRSLAAGLAFKGEVPEPCIATHERGRPASRN